MKLIYCVWEKWILEYDDWTFEKRMCMKNGIENTLIKEKKKMNN